MIAKRIESAASLLVFSDDWGRHPSSCQHLMRQMLPHYKVLWVNTIGTRAPRLDIATFKRVREKFRQWSSKKKSIGEDPPPEQHKNLKVVNPRMWPWFGRAFDRKLNAWLLSRQLKPLIEALPQPVCAVTTLPITADLTSRLPVSKWVYYCVDDFGEWPGLDGEALRSMDVQMIQRSHEIVSVSEHLQAMIALQGRQSTLLTHGVDLNHWKPCPKRDRIDNPLPFHIDGRIAVFWGVVDRRLNIDMITALSKKLKDGNIVLVGPLQDPDERLYQFPNVHVIGPRPFSILPLIAHTADVLIMPYADLPVTRAMQPLKMKEYMATGKPVVASNLPAVSEWDDCLDVTLSPMEFANVVMRRLDDGLPEDQRLARVRLRDEGWRAKALQLEHSFIPNTTQLRGE